MLAYVNWDVSPFLFDDELLNLRYYTLLMLLAFGLSMLIMYRIFRGENRSTEGFWKLSVLMILAAVIGARLGHVLFYEPLYYLKHPIEIFYLWEGGLASHGALIAMVLTAVVYCRRRGISRFWLLDRLSIPAALSAALIRIGNLFNSEIYGAPTMKFWGFKFVNSPQWYRQPIYELPCHPTQIYEAVAYFLIFFCLTKFYAHRKGTPPRGYLFSFFLISVFSLRFLIEFMKLPQVAWEKTLLSYTFLNLGQWLSLPFIIAPMIFLLRKNNKTTQRFASH